MVYFIIVLFYIFSASAETVNIHGKVSNQSGRPIGGAVVTLVGYNLIDTTDNNGEYSITKDIVSVAPKSIKPATELIQLKKGDIFFNLTKPAQIRIDFFDLNGNLLKQEFNHYAVSGTYRFELTKNHFPQMTIVRVTLGEHTTTFRYLSKIAGKPISSLSSRIPMANNSVPLARLQAAVDSVRVVAPNCTTKSFSLSSYQQTLDITMDTLARFSFFVTSLEALQDLSGSQNGFGGDLRFGKTGQGAGLLGADSICSCIAEFSMKGARYKQWRAFLSASKGSDGNQVNAIDRIGNGPWYDRRGRLLANNTSELLNDRPINADPSIKDDFPNEEGIGNHKPDPSKPAVDNHLTITGSDNKGRLYMNSSKYTCEDWTSTAGSANGPKARAGMSWPQAFGMGMKNWISAWDMSGCQPGIDLDESTMGGLPGVYTIGNGGGYGGFYCFALNP